MRAAQSLDLRGCTGREVEVLRLICRGLGNADIAAQLGISANTVKTFARHSYRKIGVTTRTQAVLWGVARGL